MNKIKILSTDTVNKIAAGEVVDRPASVIKELIENSLDAQAKNISISLEKFGKNLISVSDDGIGMKKNDLDLSVVRHATSKLNEDNIHDINSLGFRGEALPSISSVSKLTIISRFIEDKLGYKLSLLGNKNKIIEPIASNIGTKVEVRDLFFSIPARLKFLRSDRTELNAILSVIKRLALSHPLINFDVRNSKKTIFSLKTDKDVSYEQALKQRVRNILGEDFIKNSALVDYEYQNIKIYGYVSLATFSRSTSEEQFLFLNNRPIKDKLLSIALKISYQDILMKDRHPVTILFFQMNNNLFDINVHPNKTEVKFVDPVFIRSNFIQAIKKTLQENNRTSSTISDKLIEHMKHNASQNLYFLDEQKESSYIKNTTQLDHLAPQNFSKNTNQKLKEKFDANILQIESEFNNIKHSSNNARTTKNQKDKEFSSQNFLIQDNFYSKILPTAKPEVISTTIERKSLDYPMGSAKTQINDSYIISQTEEALIIVDQHAADERIVYEKIKTQLIKNKLLAQNLLIPEVIEFNDEKYLQALESKKDYLLNFALTIEQIDKKKIQIKTIPAILSQRKINIKNLVNDIAYSISDIGEDNILNTLLEYVAKTYACHYSIRAKKKLSILEMNELLREMEKTQFSAQCNHGRPTYIKLTMNEIEKLFNRK